MPGLQCFFLRNHVNTIYRARLQAQVAACALLSDDGVHLFGRAKNGINGAGLNTLGAANALRLPNKGHCFHFFFAVLCVQWRRLYIQQVGELGNRRFATGWTFIDSVTAGDCFSVGAAARVATLAALGLR